MNMQAKLLRVLQEGEIRIVGSNRSKKVDVRIISASSTPLRNLVHEQMFREDLFYRIHVYPIRVPTLNEREEDIPLLAEYFLKKFTRALQKKAESFNPSLIQFMKHHPWAGNIRELENFIERLVTLIPENKSTLDANVLPKELQEEYQKFWIKQKGTQILKPLNESMAEFEEQLIRQALEKFNWNQSKTARALKIWEQAMWYKIEKLGIKLGKGFRSAGFDNNMNDGTK